VSIANNTKNAERASLYCRDLLRNLSVLDQTCLDLFGLIYLLSCLLALYRNSFEHCVCYSAGGTAADSRLVLPQKVRLSSPTQYNTMHLFIAHRARDSSAMNSTCFVELCCITIELLQLYSMLIGIPLCPRKICHRRRVNYLFSCLLLWGAVAEWLAYRFLDL